MNDEQIEIMNKLFEETISIVKEIENLSEEEKNAMIQMVEGFHKMLLARNLVS